MGWMADETGLERNAANFVPLTPLSHLARAADIFAGHTAVVYGKTRRTYAEYRDRVSRLASALSLRGIRPGDVVATLLPNIPAQAEAHFGVPAAGAVLNTINTRLDVDTVAYIFGHGGAKIVAGRHRASSPLAEAALAAMEGPQPEIIEVADAEAGHRRASGRYTEYEELLAGGDPEARLEDARGRMGKPRAQLHLRHDRAAQGRRLLTTAAPTCMTMGTVGRLAPRAAPGLPDHRAAVSLQRLVPHLDDAARRRHAGLLPRHHREERSTTPSPTRASPISAARRSC